MSNLRLLFLILIAPSLFIFLPITLGQSIGLGSHMLLDPTSLFIIIFLTCLLYFAGANNKTYFNFHSIELKFNFLKEMFLFSAFFGTSFGIAFMWYGFTGEVNSESGAAWANLGSNMAVAILCDSYGLLFYFGTLLVKYVLEKKFEFQDRVTNRIKSNKFISLLMLLVPFIIVYLIFILLFASVDSNFNSFFGIFGKLFLSYFLIILCSSIFLIGSNFHVIIKSFLNADLELSEVVNTITSLKRFCRLIFLSLSINTLLSTVSAGTIFAYASETAIDINYIFSYIILIFSFSTFFLIYLRTFIFRLNLDLIEMNHIQISSDKYFIFKYVVPNYLLIHLISAFGFLIMIFN